MEAGVSQTLHMLFGCRVASRHRWKGARGEALEERQAGWAQHKGWPTLLAQHRQAGREHPPEIELQIVHQPTGDGIERQVVELRAKRLLCTRRGGAEIVSSVRGPQLCSCEHQAKRFGQALPAHLLNLCCHLLNSQHGIPAASHSSTAHHEQRGLGCMISSTAFPAASPAAQRGL